MLLVSHHLDDHLATALQHAQNGWFLAFQRTASPFAAQFSSSPRPSQPGNHFGMAFMPGRDVNFVGFDLARQVSGLFFTTTPSRSCPVMV
jgi:hypothetical protein